MPLSQERIFRWSYLRLDQSAYHGWLSMMTSSEGPPFLVLPRAPATLNPPLVAGLSFPLETTDQAFRRRNNGKNLILTAVQLSCIKADCDESKVHIKSAFCAKLKRNKCVMTERPVCGRRLLGLTFAVAFWTFPRWCTAQCCSNAGWNRRLVRNSMTCFCKWA